MKTILLIEDDDNIRFIFSTLLSSEGANVIEYCNCAQVDISALDNISVILCDINTPILNGIEFFTQFKESQFFSTIPFVFITGDSLAYNFIMSFRDAFLLKKPMSCDILLIVIEALTSEYFCKNKDMLS